MLHGGFPEVLARPKSRGLWFASYLQTYLEREVRAITNVRDLVTFRRFLGLLASRPGQIMVVPPYFENLGKRPPKIYWGDSGLACYLLGIMSEAELQRSPFLGQL